MTIDYVNGDLFKLVRRSDKVLIPHVCNNIGGWGSGFVVAISREWPALLEGGSPEFKYREWFRGELGSLRLGDRLGRTQFCRVSDEGMVVANMVAQNGTVSNTNRHPLKYAALVVCMKDVATLCSHDGREIHAPKFGSALAGGNWNFIAELINEIWCDQGIPVTVYEL